MNRMQEYEEMMQNLETVPASDPVQKALRRRSRRRSIGRSISCLAVVFGIFVGIINCSPSVSAACRELPLLKELVEALTFSPSLRLAIENEYIQMVGQEQTDNGVVCRVEYLIVDQKQVNIFYTLTSQDGTLLDATPEVFNPDGSHLRSSILSFGAPKEKDGIRQIVLDFVDETVPDQLRLSFQVRAVGDHTATAPVDTPEESEWDISAPDVLAELSFDLEFDPNYTQKGRTVAVNQQVELDGQSITVTDMEIYPTHLRLNVQEAEENTAWLKNLRFYLELENGTKVQTVSDGITATGSTTTPSMVSYRAESTYFYDADCLRLVITGADFLEKDKEVVHMDLVTMETDPLPQGVVLHEVQQTSSGTKVTFFIADTEESHAQLLSGVYYGPDGEEYYCGHMSSTVASENGYRNETYYLDDYLQSEVLVKLTYSSFWTPEHPVSITLTEE